MGTKTAQHRTLFPEPHEDEATRPVEILFEEEDETPCSEYVVMSQEAGMPALEEYLRESGSRLVH